MLDILNTASTLVVGLFAGSLLTEAMILVPHWRTMAPSDFFRLHSTVGPNLLRYFAPLTTAAVALAVLVPVLNHEQNIPWTIAAILCCLALLIFFLYFKKANDGFANRTISDEGLVNELTRWAMWHWIRTVIIIAAFGLSILGHTLAS